MVRVFRLLTLAGTAVSVAMAPAATQETARTIRLSAANFVIGDGVCRSGTNGVGITVEPNITGGIRIGIFESSAGAVGDMWRSAGWMAALVATTLLETDLARWRIAFDLGGRVDGPSAGALTTSGLIALLGGEDGPRADTTMTINPDGTIGPVGGIPLKVRGVAEAGYTRFGIPLGQRADVDPCTGETIDVITLGESLGVEVHELGDIRAAHAFLAGEAGPPAAPPVVAPALDPVRGRWLDDLVATWITRHDRAALATRTADPRDFGPELRAFARQAALFRDGAQADLAAGHGISAFNRSWLATVNAEFVERALCGAQALRVAGLPALHGLVADEVAGAEARVAERIDAIADVEAWTVLDASAVAWAGGQLAGAMTYAAQAAKGLARSQAMAADPRPETIETILRLAFESLGWISLAGPLADAAALDIEWVEGTGPMLGDAVDRIDAAITLHRSAALSNISYVDALVTAQIAGARQASLEAVRDDLLRADPAYLAAVGGVPAPQGSLRHPRRLT